MKTPRNLSGNDLIKLLKKKFGYKVTRQVGSHIRCTSFIKDEQHHITIPNHDPLKIGTLSAILEDIANRHNLTKQQLVEKLFK